MEHDSYSVLIRTLNCENTIEITLRSVEKQSKRPVQYIVVDSGSTDKTIDLLPSACVVHRFVGACFNYAEAINQCICYVATRYVLIISSHTALENPRAIESALNLLSYKAEIGAAYFCSDNTGPLRYDVVDNSTFDGFNGLWNTCSIVRVHLLRERPFRADVFAAEDQEWACWLITRKKMKVARFSGGGMINRNPRAHSLRKKTNDYIAVAYFADKRLLAWRNIVHVALKVFAPPFHRRQRQRLYHLWLAYRLLSCRFAKPRALSRYF